MRGGPPVTMVEEAWWWQTYCFAATVGPGGRDISDAHNDLQSNRMASATRRGNETASPDKITEEANNAYKQEASSPYEYEGVYLIQVTVKCTVITTTITATGGVSSSLSQSSSSITLSMHDAPPPQAFSLLSSVHDLWQNNHQNRKVDKAYENLEPLFYKGPYHPGSSREIGSPGHSQQRAALEYILAGGIADFCPPSTLVGPSPGAGEKQRMNKNCEDKKEFATVEEEQEYRPSAASMNKVVYCGASRRLFVAAVRVPGAQSVYALNLASVASKITDADGYYDIRHRDSGSKGLKSGGNNIITDSATLSSLINWWLSSSSSSDSAVVSGTRAVVVKLCPHSQYHEGHLLLRRVTNQNAMRERNGDQAIKGNAQDIRHRALAFTSLAGNGLAIERWAVTEADGPGAARSSSYITHIDVHPAPECVGIPAAPSSHDSLKRPDGVAKTTRKQEMITAAASGQLSGGLLAVCCSEGELTLWCTFRGIARIVIPASPPSADNAVGNPSVDQLCLFANHGLPLSCSRTSAPRNGLCRLGRNATKDETKHQQLQQNQHSKDAKEKRTKGEDRFFKARRFNNILVTKSTTGDLVVWGFEDRDTLPTPLFRTALDSADPTTMVSLRGARQQHDQKSGWGRPKLNCSSYAPMIIIATSDGCCRATDVSLWWEGGLCALTTEEEALDDAGITENNDYNRGDVAGFDSYFDTAEDWDDYRSDNSIL